MNSVVFQILLAKATGLKAAGSSGDLFLAVFYIGIIVIVLKDGLYSLLLIIRDIISVKKLILALKHERRWN